MYMNRIQEVGAAWRSRWLTFIAFGLAIVFAAHATAQAPAAPGGAAPPMSAEELGKLVGPIALYPDDLVGIILPASTFPLQIVQADRYLDKRKADPKLPVDEKWDDSVKSLLNYPDVVGKMSDDLDWTTALGEAVVADQGAVIEAVQAFRRKAQAAGNLKSDDKQVVKVEQQIVYIEPANPQVIYVPQYNPTTVVVASPTPVYAYYPTPYPSYYYPYPPGAALATGVIWGAAIGAAWSGNRYGCCGDANINVNRNTNINTGNINRGGARQQPAGGTAWKSNKQPGQVAGSTAGPRRRRAQVMRVRVDPPAPVGRRRRPRAAQRRVEVPAVAATPWAVTARDGKPRWTARVARRVAARCRVRARGRRRAPAPRVRCRAAAVRVAVVAAAGAVAVAAADAAAAAGVERQESRHAHIHFHRKQGIAHEPHSLLVSPCAGLHWRCWWPFRSSRLPRRRKPSRRRKRPSTLSWRRSKPTAIRRWSRSSAKSTRISSSHPIARRQAPPGQRSSRPCRRCTCCKSRARIAGY